MARKETHSQNEAEISKEDIIFNRQINFWVMRRLWKNVYGRAKNGQAGKSIYATLNMSRERYTRAINGETIRFSKEELKTLIKQTGMSKGIFDGTTCFQFKYIARGTWKQLFDLRNKVQEKQGGKKNKDCDKLKTEEEAVFKLMNVKDINIVETTDLFNFNNYLEKLKEPAPDKVIEDIMQKVNVISFEQWQYCEVNALQDYSKALTLQLDRVNTIIQYRKYTNTHT